MAYQCLCNKFESRDAAEMLTHIKTHTKRRLAIMVLTMVVLDEKLKEQGL